MISLLLPSLALALPTDVDESTVVPVDVLLGLESEPQAAGPATTWFVQRSSLRVEPQADALIDVRLDLEIVSLEPTWVEIAVLDGRVRLPDNLPGIHQRNDGQWWFTGRVDGRRTLRLEGTVDGNEQLALRVAPGVRQDARGVGEGLEFDIFGSVGDRLPPTELVEIAWSPRRPPAPVVQVVQGAASTAAWIDEGDLRVRSKVRWTVRRGELATLQVTVPSSAQELDVLGPGIETWSRSGNTVTIQPGRVVDGVFDATVEWRTPFQKGAAAIQQPTLPGTTSTTHSLTLAGSSELVLSPTVSGGMRAGAVAELSEQARSIGDAPPTAAWTGPGTLSLKALSLTSLEGPALVIDQATCTEASAQAGRNLLSCRLDVRNASRQYLRVTPAPGGHLWSATVNGRGVTPVVLEDGTMGVPLERSVETLSGLTTLDVELVFAGEHEAWTRKGRRARALPTFDAPVAQLVWELRLPPGFSGEIEGGSAREGQEATTEIVYAASIEERSRGEEARNSWNEALRAYQRNDFDSAQSYIDQTLSLDSGNENAMRLQGNLDVLAGGPETGADEAMTRRVKDMAKAKVAEVEVKQKDTLDEAERRLNSGDYDGAIALYEELEKSSNELQRYEQTESKEQAFYSSSSSAGLKEAKKRSASNATSEAPAQGQLAEQRVTESLAMDGKGATLDSGYLDNLPVGRSYSSVLGTTSGASGTTASKAPSAAPAKADAPAEVAQFGWSDLKIEGELLVPQGAEIAEPPPSVPEEPMLYVEQDASGEFLAYEYEAMPLAEPEPTPDYAIAPGGGGGYVVDAFDGDGDGDYDDYEDYEDYGVEYDVDELDYESFDDGLYGELADVEDYRSSGRATVQATQELLVLSAGVHVGGDLTILTPEDTLADASIVDVPQAGTPLSYYVARSAERVRGAVGGRIYDATHPPPPTTERPETVLSGLPDLAATTLAIPLPDHGQSLSVVQRLLAPGEASTLEITYRETR